MEKEQLLKDFLENSTILIMDRIPSARNRLCGTLVEMGAKNEKIFCSSNFSDGLIILEKQMPSLIVCDYQINGGSGFEFFEMAKQKERSEQSLFILLTSNFSQSAVARGAEEEVDAYILRPYTVRSFKQILENTLRDKINPSFYMKQVQLSSKMLAQGNISGAEKILKMLLQQEGDGALAFGKLAQIEEKKERVDLAEANYRKGLSKNKLHFKCLSGLFDLLIKAEMWSEAYSIGRELIKFFPGNPQRLSRQIRLAVQTSHFKDIGEILYNDFSLVEQETEDVLAHMCSGLFVAGKFYLKKHNTDEALRFYLQMAQNSQSQTRFLRAGVEELSRQGLVKEARHILDFFPPQNCDSEDYWVANYLVKEEEYSREESAQQGLNLIAKLKSKSKLTYLKTIAALREIGDQEAARSLELEAEKSENL